MDGEWQEANYWDWSSPVLNDDGTPVMNKVNKPKNQPFFTQYFEFLLKFDEPIDVSHWDKELKQTVVEAFDEFYGRVSKNLKEKILEQVEDERNPSDAKFILDYDKTKMPADQYKVKFHKG